MNSYSSEGAASRLARLGYSQAAQSHWGSGSSGGGGGGDGAAENSNVAGDGCVVEARRATLRMAATRRKPDGNPNKEALMTPPAAAVVDNLERSSTPPPPPPTLSALDEHEEHEERLFSLTCKHCGTNSMTKYGVSLHYFVAGIDAEENDDAAAAAEQNDGDRGEEQQQTPPAANAASLTPEQAATAATSSTKSSATTKPKGSKKGSSSKESSSSSSSKKARLVFCVAENPMSQSKSVADRVASWSIITTIKRVHLVCTPEALKTMFHCFVSGGGGDGGGGASSASSMMAVIAKEITRSTSVPFLASFLCVYDQSAVAQHVVVTYTPAAAAPAAGGESFKPFAKMWDNEGSVWCPVTRLRRIVIRDAATGEMKPTFALEPLTVALKEDASYVCNLPIMRDLQDRYTNMRQMTIDKHVNDMRELQDEIKMLEEELSWMVQDIEKVKRNSERKLKEGEASLVEYHSALMMTTTTATTGARLSPPAAVLVDMDKETSPIRRHFAWHNVVDINDSNNNVSGGISARYSAMKMSADDSSRRSAAAASPLQSTEVSRVVGHLKSSSNNSNGLKVTAASSSVHVQRETATSIAKMLFHNSTQQRQRTAEEVNNRSQAAAVALGEDRVVGKRPVVAPRERLHA